MRHALFALSLTLAAVSATAGEAARHAVLPPELPWSGRSRALALPPGDPWATPFERSGLTGTPRYDETVAWLKRLAAASPKVQLVSLGRSPEGRDLWMVVASREAAATPQALKASGKPTLLAQAGIHAGEIDGKDAGLMLLRDIVATKTKADLLDKANLLFIPIFNVDGHERFSAFTRINQRGPNEAGWRTTARNLNLNRDYTKADTPEMQALLRALNAWDPDLYFDIHVTDGADYQYDITLGANAGGLSPAIDAWFGRALLPGVHRDLVAMGHIPGPFVSLVDDKDPAKGLVDWTAGPRYSNGYGDARHLPTILVETHSLKAYAQRVLGTYVLLESSLRILGAEWPGLRQAVREDRGQRRAEVPLDWKPAPALAGTLDLQAVAWRIAASPVSGDTRVEWLGTPLTVTIPRIPMRPAVFAKRPRAWWVPAAWRDVIERLRLHGIQVEEVPEAKEVDVEMVRVGDPKLGEVFEGRVPVTGTFTPGHRRERYAAGSVRVPSDQPLGDLAALLLEPASPDSFFQWGFFLEVLQPTEGAEAYVLEPMAERMLAEDPALKAEFEKRLAGDPAFAKDPAARREWLYGRTPFFDERWLLYPVGREM